MTLIEGLAYKGVCLCVYIYMHVRVNIWNPLMSSMFSVSELVSPYKRTSGNIWILLFMFKVSQNS